MTFDHQSASERVVRGSHFSAASRSSLAMPWLVALALCAGCGDDDKKSSGSDSPLASTPGCGAGMTTPAIEGCTQAQLDTFASCVEQACETTYETCYGPNYAKGEFGGACKDFLECAEACGCENTSCTSHCEASDACNQCVLENPCGTECLPSCTVPASSAGCKELTVCCNAMAAGNDKTDCLSIVTMAKKLGGQADFYCGTSYSIFSQTGVCK